MTFMIEVGLVVPDQFGGDLYEVSAETVEHVRHMLTRLNRNNALPARLALVAALRHEGVSHLSRAIAAIMAHDLNVRVCVVELNWWWPAPAPAVPAVAGGLAAVVANLASVEEVTVTTGWPTLSLIPSLTSVPMDERPVLARNPKLKQIITQLSQQYDHLILDIPAVLATSDAIALASLADGCAVVVQQGATPINSVRSALDDIDHLKVLGVIMNQVDIAIPEFVQRLIPED
jgi:Mrp family chromosome partitioning ATPase